MKPSIREKIWNFGTKYAPLIKRIPLIRSLADGMYSHLAKARTNEVYSPQYLEQFRKSASSAMPSRQLSGTPLGINIVGFIETESGVGEAVRSNIRALEALQVPHVLNNLETVVRHCDRTFGSFSDDNPYRINLIHVNADQVPAFIVDKGVGYFGGKYNIGSWVWELPEFPRKWQVLTQYFDEIWTPSSFCTNAISQHCDVSVKTVPYSISGGNISHLNRSYFGLRDDCFIFLFMFDMLSIFERKNPLAVIESFRSAFAPSENAMLVIKFVNAASNRLAAGKIADAIQGLRGKIIDQYMDKDEVHALMSMSDCYVSLHRSEGFGFTVAECMALGKPVIATAYSGNMDFMNYQNSFPVRYQMATLSKDYGPYRKGSTWADPDRMHAAELMRFVYENREEAAARGEVAAKDIRNNLSPSAVGSIIKKRIEIIACNMEAQYPASKQLTASKVTSSCGP